MKVNVEVTPEMVKAGSDIASVLLDASIAKCMNGLGGSKTWEEFVEGDVRNQDIVIDYLEDRIESVTAIYLAMERARGGE